MPQTNMLFECYRRVYVYKLVVGLVGGEMSTSWLPITFPPLVSRSTLNLSKMDAELESPGISLMATDERLSKEEIYLHSPSSQPIKVKLTCALGI